MAFPLSEFPPLAFKYSYTPPPPSFPNSYRQTDSMDVFVLLLLQKIAEIKKAGNAAFQKENYKAAIEHYTEALTRK